MNHTTTLLTVLLLAPLGTAAAADSSTTLRFDTPASTFHESLPLGNGRIGAMVFGGLDEERIVLNEGSRWSDSRETDADRPGANKFLPEDPTAVARGRQCRGRKTGLHACQTNLPATLQTRLDSPTFCVN